MSAVDPTELVAGAWQLRPWPAAYADLDDVLAEQGLHGAALLAERHARLDGWRHGAMLGFAVREITTGASVGEVVVRLDTEQVEHLIEHLAVLRRDAHARDDVG